MAKFFLLSLLVVAVSMVESYTVVPYPSAAVPLPYGYPVAAPVSAGFRQSSLGPFFGYFPDMFSAPCPACNLPAAKDDITECPADQTISDMSASPTGTIKVALATASTACKYAILTTPGYKTIKIRCSKLPTGALKMGPSVTPVPEGSNTYVTGTDYTATGQVVLEFAAAAASEEIDCTWTAMA